jgi:endonuclease YncB( thermonuclease family)|tara:strand:+ start:1336 stop:1770 length:435 start_codon:yes stop_codon:yes gene_type:complete
MVLLQECTYKNTEAYVPEIKECKIVKCYDGDTVTIAIVIDNKGYRFSVRMLGYDCAEIRSKDEQEKKVAKWAKEYITSMIYDKVVTVVQNDGYDKYGRLLLKLEINGININDVMLEKWGVSYFGGHKEKIDWSLWDESGRGVPV